MRGILFGAIVVLSSATALADDSGPNVIEGTKKGYSAEIVVVDVSAALLIPATIAPTWSDNPWIWSIPLSGAPLALGGPIMHLAHGRIIAASASFLGWTSVIATSWAVGGLATMMFRLSDPCVPSQFHACSPAPDRSWAGAAMGIGVGVLGTALMTWLDAWLARPFHKATHTRQQTLSPTVSMSGAGASAALLGSF